MSPLVALLLFGFMFVIALSLTVWAALTLRDGPRAADEAADEVSYVPLGGERRVWRREEAARAPLAGFERRSGASGTAAKRARSADGRRASDRPALSTGLPAVTPQAAVPLAPAVSTGEELRPQRAAQVTVRGAAGASADGQKSNDEYRGARATVTQRPNNDDAFERFLENNRD